MTHNHPKFKSTVNLTIVHQIPPRNPLLIITLVHIFRQIEFNSAQKTLLTTCPRGKLLDDFELNIAFLENLVLVDCESNM